LIEKQLRPGSLVLRQLALLHAESPEVGALLLSAVPAVRRRRSLAGGPETPIREEASRLIGDMLPNGTAPDAEELSALTVMLYSSPERAVTQDDGGQVQLSDLSNLLDASDAEDDLLALLTAQRLQAALRPEATRMLLPLELDGDPLALELEHSRLGSSHYQTDQHLRLRLATAAQGPVEVQLRTHGNSLSVQLLVREELTASAYAEDLAELRAALEALGPALHLHDLRLRHASLPWHATGPGSQEDRLA
jgi:hypothetical protein